MARASAPHLLPSDAAAPPLPVGLRSPGRAGSLPLGAPSTSPTRTGGSFTGSRLYSCLPMMSRDTGTDSRPGSPDASGKLEPPTPGCSGPLRLLSGGGGSRRTSSRSSGLPSSSGPQDAAGATAATAALYLSPPASTRSSLISGAGLPGPEPMLTSGRSSVRAWGSAISNVSDACDQALASDPPGARLSARYSQLAIDVPAAAAAPAESDVITAYSAAPAVREARGESDHGAPLPGRKRSMVHLKLTREDGSADLLPFGVYALRNGRRMLGVPRRLLASKLGLPLEALAIDVGHGMAAAAAVAADEDGGEALVSANQLPYVLMMLSSPKFKKRNSALSLCQELLRELDEKRGENKELNEAYHEMAHSFFC